MNFAVVEISGHQYVIREGDVLEVEKLTAVEAGQEFSLPRVFLVSDGSETQLGTPVVDGAQVKARLLAHDRAEKIRVIRFIPKKRQKSVRGHRQHYSQIEILSITAPGISASQKTEQTPAPTAE